MSYVICHKNGEGRFRPSPSLFYGCMAEIPLLLSRCGGGELLQTPPYLRMSQLPCIYCLLTPLRTILSAARGVLWKSERKSMEFLWGISLGNFFGEFLWGSWERCRRFYGPSAGLSIRIRPFPSGRRRASVVARRRSCAALAQGVRFVTDAGRASRAIARKRGIDEAGLARHIRRGSQPLIHHLSDPQGS